MRNFIVHATKWGNSGVFPHARQFRTLLNSITSHFFQRRRNGTCEHSLDSLSFCALGSSKISMFVCRKNFLASVFHAKVNITCRTNRLTF